MAFVVKKLKGELGRRGAKGMVGLGRKFKIMDDDGSKALDLSEFKKAMKEMNMGLNDVELRKLFEHFDQDRSGSIDYEEFVQGIRDPLTPRRLDLVHQAFAKIDIDGSGEVQPHEVVDKYNADKHPDVISGKKTKDEVMREFLDTFDVGGVKDGVVTRKEFENYYTNLGANIDNEDYFELMIRNAWHISGGKGAAANSANKRVLVTRPDGTQAVVEIEDDLGLDLVSADKRKEDMIRRLKAQGLDVANIDTGGSTDQAEPEVKTGGLASGQTKTPGKAHHPNNPTFTSSITLAGVGEGAGRNRVGKVNKFNIQKRGAVAADHLDIHASDLRKSLGTAMKKPASKKVVSLAEASGTGGVSETLKKLKEQLATRGARGIIGLGRKFKIMDDNGNGALSPDEFTKAMNECAISLKSDEMTALFKYFDKDGSGDIDFEEFLSGVRGVLNARRLDMVQQAFAVIDKDGNGFVEPHDIVECYNADKHPDVMSGKKTADEVLREFLDTFDVGGEKDGKVTRNEFQNYYSNVSASVDNDDYFELMMRNSWHISGGKGWCANSANKRVLVTDSRGNQSVQEIKNDLGLDLIDEKDRKDEMARRLKAQGVDVVGLSSNGAVEEKMRKPKKSNPNFSQKQW